MTHQDAKVQGATIRCASCGRQNRIPAATEGVPRCGECHEPLPWIADADDDTFADISERASVPVLVDLWAKWWNRSLRRTPDPHGEHPRLRTTRYEDAPRA